MEPSRLPSSSARPRNLTVSIIIGTYNRPDYLRRVIAGYLEQTRRPNEIVIGDDGSGSETAGLIQELQKTTEIPIHHIWHEDQGFRLAAIRNQAIARSSGEYLILCDDETIPAPKLVADHLNCAEEGCFLQGHRVLLGPAASRTFTHRDAQFFRVLRDGLHGQAQNLSNALHLPVAYLRKSRRLRGIRGCNMSFFRTDVLAVNGFNEELEGWGKDDTELAVRFFKYGLKRKDMIFQGACYHLYHPPYSRENLSRNIAILEKTQQDTAYWCRKGVDQYLRG